MHSTTTYLSVTLLAALMPTATLAHGYLVDPQPTFVNPGGDPTGYSATIDGNVALPGENYNLSPQDNTIAFTRQLKKSSFASLRAFIDAQGNTGGECGLTRADGTPRSLPSDSKVKWAHGSEGFVLSHEGPCELWCDATRVYENDNCARNIPDGVMPINSSQCQGSEKLIMLWLALHTSQWQVYKNCVRLTSGDGSSPVPPPSSSSGTPTMNPRPPSSSTPTSHAPKSTSPPSEEEAQPWQQCGGKTFNGPTRCVAQYACVWMNDWYSQCTPAADEAEETEDR
ncbi:hypothetical protein AaE_012680 [Aphanomyces astaci]|uniref:CBM1 domain-containing protein n=1 Tax=Aphanomyces astaci TaxID=112090 RepID=A0A6A4ZEU4_APHAT|nr:hypothetical protein AaE_012680 [Aphanomyces astaci]